MFKTIDPLATNWGNRLGILHRSFIDINTDLKTLSKSNGGIKNFGHLFNFATKQDIQNFQQFNRVIEDGQNAQRSYNTYLSTAPTSLRQLGSAIVDVKKEQYDLNTAYNQGKISQDEYNNKMQACNTRLQELRGSSNALTLSQKALNTAMRIGSTVANMAFNAAIGIAISAIISVIQKVINAEKELIQKNKELADSYKNNVQALEDYREKYLDIIDSTDSEAEKDKQLIEWKKQLVKQYGLEEEALANVNKERQTGIDLINQELYKEATKTISELKGYEEAYKKIYNASNVIYNQRSYNAMRGFEQYGIGFDAISNRDGSFNIKIVYDTNDANKQLEQLEKLLSDLKTKSLQLDKDDPLYNQFHSSLNNQIEFVQKEYDRVKQVIDDYSTTVSTGVSAYAQKYLYEFTQQTDGALANVIDQASFNAWKDKLLEMAGDSEPVKEALEKLANEMFPNYSSSVDNSTVITNNAITSVTSLADTFKALKEALEDIIGYADTYQSAMGKIASGTALTAEEVVKLLEIDPTLYDKFTKTKDGWQIDYSYLRDSLNENVTDAIAKKVGGTKEEFETALEQGNSRLEELQKQRNEILSKPIPESAKQEQLKSVNEQIKNIEDVINNSEQGINLTDFYSKLFNFTDSDVITGAFDDVIDKIDEYNDNITSLNNSIDTLNEGNSLSYDEMTGLVNLYPQLQDKVVKTTNGYTIEKSALEDVRIQSYKARNDYIDNQIAQTKAAIEQTKARMETYTHEIALISSASAYKAALESGLLEQYWNDERTIKSMEELIKLFESYKSEVLDPDNSSSSKDTISDKLQNQIDYYKMLLEAIGIVSDKVVEGLEKEKDAIDQKIDALNDEKDALQEKNDEQQRELDLIEAKNNLDKAKKQKVFVYKEGQGLVQVQDKKAVADAQKEYDDIQKEIKIANIDKQIDVYDKQKEAIEDQIDAQQKYGEQFTNMESDIQDTLTVEQAKKALGTDEKGLLSLDDKTIAGIRDGLATATYNKDVEDNKENSKYITVKLEDFLKSVGATVTPTEFKAMASTITNNPANIIPATNANSTINNAQTINNKTANFNATFNIYDALDPYKIIDTVKEYFNGVLKQTINSVK